MVLRHYSWEPGVDKYCKILHKNCIYAWMLPATPLHGGRTPRSVPALPMGLPATPGTPPLPLLHSGRHRTTKEAAKLHPAQAARPAGCPAAWSRNTNSSPTHLLGLPATLGASPLPLLHGGRRRAEEAAKLHPGLCPWACMSGSASLATTSHPTEFHPSSGSCVGLARISTPPLPLHR